MRGEGEMLQIENTGVANLETGEAGRLRGGGGLDAGVSLAGLMVTAAGLGFKWGYEHLGPLFNRFF
jgi:hypothetical protein